MKSKTAMRASACEAIPVKVAKLATSLTVEAASTGIYQAPFGVNPKVIDALVTVVETIFK